MTGVDEAIEMVEDVPLVVDMDGTLIKVDSLHEAFVQALARTPLYTMRALLTLKRGPAAFKAAIADCVLPDPETVPVNEEVLELIKQAKIEGRRVYLATAADRRFAKAISDAIGLFDGIFASGDGINLKGKAKADQLANRFGVRGFDYIGNDATDIPVWRVARAALVVGTSRNLAKRVALEHPQVIDIGSHEIKLRKYLSALRPHQWLKNALVALPAAAGHSFSPSVLITVLVAVISFSFGASSVYLVNDMLDLPHDRIHPQKRRRPIAAGAMSLSHATILLAVVALISIGAALLLPWAFMLILFCYFGLSLSYSLYLKRKLMIDVVALAALYGIRVLAGGAATGIVLSHWLVGFCFFIFLSLALVKRQSEIISLPSDTVGNVKGRGYRLQDLQSLTALTAASGFVSVLVLALYISSADVNELYRAPELLWGICILLVYWLGRVYFLTGRGEMHQDPVIFAATDRISLVTAILVIAIFFLAL
jgi:4-hydroxybenzoate polyprenyltransferase/phosphoserine phosphatase